MLEGTVSSIIAMVESSIRAMSGLAVVVEMLGGSVDGRQSEALQLGMSA